MNTFKEEMTRYDQSVIKKAAKAAGRKRITKKFRAEVMSRSNVKRNKRAKLRRESEKEKYKSSEIYDYELSENIKPLPALKSRTEKAQVYSNDLLFGSIVRDIEDSFNATGAKRVVVKGIDGKEKKYEYFSDAIREAKESSGLGKNVNFIFNANLIKFEDENDPHEIEIELIAELQS